MWIVQAADVQDRTIPASSLRNEEEKAVKGGIVQLLCRHSHDRTLLWKSVNRHQQPSFFLPVGGEAKGLRSTREMRRIGYEWDPVSLLHPSADPGVWNLPPS
eukprot:GHVT01040324.1.p2 GENE.GHVT01040324.1~~GHVT01040324.1.p2  ORF type:complete len:102 (+),score=4.98 GHVT01040324.1:265-570(+)